MKSPKNLVEIKSYRLPPLLSLEVSTTATKMNITASEFVRRAITEAIVKNTQHIPTE